MNLHAAEFLAPTVAWASLTPIVIILGAAVLGVLVESFAPVKARRPVVIGLSLLATLAAGVVLALRWETVVAKPSTLGEYVEDTFTLAAQLILVVIAFLAILVMGDRTFVGDGAFAAQPSDKPGSAEEERSLKERYQRSEIFPLALFSLGGMMVFPAANSFVTLFVALELMSLPLYILAATARRRRQLSQEAGMKYFLLGAFASAFMLMGSALLYGFSGTLTISEVGKAVPQTMGMDWLLVTGVLFVMVGLLFKVGAVPFHAWTPDVYTGAPTPVTGFMAAGVKVAAFGAMLRFYQVVAGYLQWDFIWIVGGVAILTMIVGTVVGIVQTDIKRMLAYSSIAHAGFILIGVLALTKGSAGSVLFYILAYGVASVGAFGVVTLVRSRDTAGGVGGEATALNRWAGIGRKSPMLGLAMVIFLLSFAGIPLTGGFVSKFVVFAGGVSGGMLALVIIALICSVVTAFYYFRVIRLMFFTEPTDDTVVVSSEGLSAVAVVFCAVVILVMGIFPGPILNVLSQVAILLP